MHTINNTALAAWVRLETTAHTLPELNEDGLATSEVAALTGIGITIASLAGALLYQVTQTIINSIPSTVNYPS